jgi:hypothetical protein
MSGYWGAKNLWSAFLERRMLERCERKKRGTGYFSIERLKVAVVKAHRAANSTSREARGNRHQKKSRSRVPGSRFKVQSFETEAPSNRTKSPARRPSKGPKPKARVRLS